MWAVGVWYLENHSTGSALSQLSYFQGRSGSHPESFGPQRVLSCLYPLKLSIFTPELIWDSPSHGICFVHENIFEPQVSSALLIADLSVVTVSPGKASSGEKASGVCTSGVWAGRSFLLLSVPEGEGRWGVRHTPRAALSHSDPQLQFGPLVLLVEARAAFECSELKMRAGLTRNTETTPVNPILGLEDLPCTEPFKPNVLFCKLHFIISLNVWVAVSLKPTPSPLNYYLSM